MPGSRLKGGPAVGPPACPLPSERSSHGRPVVRRPQRPEVRPLHDGAAPADGRRRPDCPRRHALEAGSRCVGADVQRGWSCARGRGRPATARPATGAGDRTRGWTHEDQRARSGQPRARSPVVWADDLHRDPGDRLRGHGAQPDLAERARSGRAAAHRPGDGDHRPGSRQPVDAARTVAHRHAAARDPGGPAGGPACALHESTPGNRSCDAAARGYDRCTAGGDHRRRRHAAIELAGGDPAIHRAEVALRAVPSRRAVGQRAQPVPDPADADGLRLPERRHEAGPDHLSAPRRPRRRVRAEESSRRRRRSDPRPAETRHWQQVRVLDHGRRGTGGPGRRVDEARGTFPLAPRGRGTCRSEIRARGRRYFGPPFRRPSAQPPARGRARGRR